MACSPIRYEISQNFFWRYFARPFIPGSVAVVLRKMRDDRFSQNVWPQMNEAQKGPADERDEAAKRRSS